jgi:hypothetical protein
MDFRRVKKNYDTGLWNKEMVKTAVEKGVISKAQYVDITKEEFWDNKYEEVSKTIQERGRQMNRVLWVMAIISFISLIGILYTYNYGTSGMQGVWSGTLLTSMAAYMLIEDELQKERREAYERHIRGEEETN